MTNPFETPSLETSSQEEPELNKQNWRAKLEKLAPGQLILLLLFYYAISFACSYMALFVNYSQDYSDSALLIASFTFSSISLINIFVTIYALVILHKSRWLIGVLPCLFIEICMLLWYSLELQPDSEALYNWVTFIWLRGVMLCCIFGLLSSILLMISDFWRWKDMPWLHWVGVFFLPIYYLIMYFGHIQNMIIMY